jgi:response regulator of citrate/malate metabolism
MTWRVLVVEDDPIVAKLHCRLVGGVPGLEIVGVARHGEEALRTVARARPHLVLLDLGLPGMNGVTFLRELRARSFGCEVIAVTAVRTADVVRETLHFGVLDYLVKPFTNERLRQSLNLFIQRTVTLNDAELEQDSIDVISRAQRRGRRWLPKGLAEDTLAEVRDRLASAEDPVSADAVATDMGISRVTVRRYLEYLVAIGDAAAESAITGRGRPRKLYRPV